MAANVMHRKKTKANSSGSITNGAFGFAETAIHKGGSGCSRTSFNRVSRATGAV